MTRTGRTGGPPDVGAQWWRRRFLRLALVISAIWVLFGVLFGVVGRRNERFEEDRGPPPVVAAVVVAAVVATFVAYRRVARPVSELLDVAARVGDGDYGARVRPSGPRSVRTLGRSFNDMAMRLDSSEQARRRFLADVTHELRTPLTVLQAGVEAQLDGIHQRDDEHLTTLLDQTRTLDRLVEDLRTLALGDAGQLTLHPELVSVDVIVDDAIAAIAPAASRRGISVTSTEGLADVEMDLDPVRLGQVLTNLLTNAVRHTPPRRLGHRAHDRRSRRADHRRHRHRARHRRRSRAALRPLPDGGRLRGQWARPHDRPAVGRGPRRPADGGQRRARGAPASR